MNRVDTFFILMLLLLSGLTVTYKAAQYDLSGLEFQKLVNARLTKKIEILELKQKELELAAVKARAPDTKRVPASLVEPTVELDPALFAKDMYQQIRSDCQERKKELQCIEKIDSLVSQFPESKWTAESLLVLSDFYRKRNKAIQAGEILKLVRIEFKKYPDIIKKLNRFENQSL